MPRVTETKCEQEEVKDCCVILTCQTLLQLNVSHSEHAGSCK